MNSDRAAILLHTIEVRTNQGTIPWTATASDDAYECSFTKNSVRIVKEEGYDGESQHEYVIYRLDILDDSGKVIETISPHELRDKFDNPWRATAALFNLAREKALGIDEAVEDLLKELGGAVPLPEINKPDELDDEIPF